MPTAPAVTLRGLSKRFGDKVAVDGVALEVPSGCFFGLVGPNGAGKTTTLRMVTGLLRPDAGDILVDGLDVRYEPTAVKSRIGVLPEDLLLFERLTGAELLTYAGLLRGLAPDLVAHRSVELLAVLGLTDDAGTLVVDYSHGMRKKIALAAPVARSTGALPRRTLRGHRPGVVPDHPLGPRAGHRTRSDGGAVQPRHGDGGADVQPHRRHACRPGGGEWTG